MRNILRMIAALLLLGGCAAGPRYTPSPVLPAGTHLGAIHGSDTTRAFYDSLAAAPPADSTTPAQKTLPPLVLSAESSGDLLWLDILQDSTLTRLVRTALRQNRDLSGARERIEEYRALASVAASPLFPGLALNGSVSRNKVNVGTQLEPTYDAYRATADLSWEIDVFGRTRRGLEAARDEREGQEASERAVVLSLVADVSTAYLELRELDQEHAIAGKTLESRKATLELARQRYAQGVISELDVRQFEAQVAVPAARLAQVEQLQAQQEHALDVLLGEGPSRIPPGTSLAETARGVVAPDSVPAALIERRPDVAAAERAYAAANARVGAADASRLPGFFITGSYGTQAPTSNTVFQKTYEIYEMLAGVSVPLFNGGQLSGSVQAARAQAEEARDRYQQTLLQAVSEASDALSDVRSARKVAAAEETQASALRRALDLAEMRYRTGVSNYLEVLDAERSLFDAELAASQAELQQLTSAVRLYKALGGSWPEGR